MRVAEKRGEEGTREERRGAERRGEESSEEKRSDRSDLRSKE